jgi:hypothetical protein
MGWLMGLVAIAHVEGWIEDVFVHILYALI